MFNILKISLSTILFLFIFACGNPPAINIPEKYQPLYGTWEARTRNSTGEITTNDLALTFDSDNRVTYYRCIKGPNRRNHRDLPRCNLIALNDSEFTIRLQLWKFGLSEHFAINRLPYEVGDQWKMEVDGVVLTKLKSGESSDYKTWECTDDFMQTVKKRKNKHT